MTVALLQSEKKMHDVVDLLTQSNNQAAEDICKLETTDDYYCRHRIFLYLASFQLKK